MSRDARGFKTVSGKYLAWNDWHNFGGPCSYRVTGPTRRLFAIRLDATGEVDRPRGPSGKGALLMAMSLEQDSYGYSTYAFGHAAIDKATVTA